MITSIDQCRDENDVVKYINEEASSPEKAAVAYAQDQNEYGYDKAYSDLEHLQELGADFDFEEAVKLLGVDPMESKVWNDPQSYAVYANAYKEALGHEGGLLQVKRWAIENYPSDFED